MPQGPFLPALDSVLLRMLASFSYSVHFLHLMDVQPLSLMPYGSTKGRLPFSALQHQVKYLYNSAGGMGRWHFVFPSQSKSQGSPTGTAPLTDPSSCISWGRTGGVTGNREPPFQTGAQSGPALRERDMRLEDASWILSTGIGLFPLVGSQEVNSFHYCSVNVPDFISLNSKLNFLFLLFY